MSARGHRGSRSARGACSGSCLADCARGEPDGLELPGGEVLRTVDVPFTEGRLRRGAACRLAGGEGSGLPGSLPFGQRGRGDGPLQRSLEFDLAGDPAPGADLEGEPGVFLGPLAAQPARHGVIVRDGTGPWRRAGLTGTRVAGEVGAAMGGVVGQGGHVVQAFGGCAAGRCFGEGAVFAARAAADTGTERPGDPADAGAANLRGAVPAARPAACPARGE